MKSIEVLPALILFTLMIHVSLATQAIAPAPSPPPVTQTTLEQVPSSLQMFVDELPQIPKVNGYSMRNGSAVTGFLTIGMFQKKWKFHRDLRPTTVFACGTSKATATVPGPMIEALKGVSTSVTWENHLHRSHILPWDPTLPTAKRKYGGVPTVAHLHDGIHPSQVDGNPLAWYTSHFKETGSGWTQKTYTYPNVQNAGNLWYHVHAHGITHVNLLAGLLGPYTIHDPWIENPRNLPTGSEQGRNLMVFDRSFYKNGSLYINSTGDNPSIHPQWQPEYYGDTIIVHGKIWPFLKVRRRKYRFRITNASNARYYNFSLDDGGLSFIQVGSDAFYLNSPVTAQNILLAPAESADVVIDFSTSTTKEIVLTNNAPYPYPSGSPADHLSGKIMKFIVLPNKKYDISQIPASLVNYPVATTNGAATTRYITLYEYDSNQTGNPTHIYINGKRFSDPVTEMPKMGTKEVWEVINLTPDNHPLHIHLATFQAIKVQQLLDFGTFMNCMNVRNDAIACNVTTHASGPLLSIAENEKTWKNVVKIMPGYQTTVVVNFNMVKTNGTYPFDATAEPGYVYHCHILDHEDNDMMRPLKMVR